MTDLVVVLECEAVLAQHRVAEGSVVVAGEEVLMAVLDRLPNQATKPSPSPPASQPASQE